MFVENFANFYVSPTLFNLIENPKTAVLNWTPYRHACLRSHSWSGDMLNSISIWSLVREDADKQLSTIVHPASSGNVKTKQTVSVDCINHGRYCRCCAKKGQFHYMHNALCSCFCPNDRYDLSLIEKYITSNYRQIWLSNERMSFIKVSLLWTKNSE